MNRFRQLSIIVMAWTLLVGFTHWFIYEGILSYFDTEPWAYDLTFFIVAGVYAYIFIRYSVRIEILIENKRVFYFRNRRK